MKDKKFYITIIEYIRQNHKLPKKLFYKQLLSYYLKTLKIEGVVIKKGYGTYEINEQKYLEFVKNFEKKKVKKSRKVSMSKVKENKIFTSSKKIIRGHGFVFSLDLEKLPKIPYWQSRKKFMESRKIDFKNIWKNRDGEQIIYKGHKIWLTNKKITIYTPKGLSYFGESAEDSQKNAIYDVHSLLKYIENLFNISLSIRGKYSIDIVRQHYGKVNDDLAKDYSKRKDKLEVKQEGKTWLLIDNSFNLHELETVDNLRSKDDMDNKIVPFFNDLRDNKVMLPSEVQATLNILISQMTEMAKAQTNTQHQVEAFIKSMSVLFAVNKNQPQPDNGSNTDPGNIPDYIG